MRNIIRICILVSLTFSLQKLKAQLKGFSIGPFAEIGWPVNDFSKTHHYGLGAGLGADLKLPGKWGITGSIAYMQFNGKEITTMEETTKAPAIKAVPIRAGIKFRVLPLIYLKMESGVVNYSGDQRSAFIVSPGIGVRLLNLELQGKYENWVGNGNTHSFWGLKAGFNF